MPNQHTKLTRSNIQKKINRKTNPVGSVLQLAREFGVDTSFRRQSGYRGGTIDHRAPTSFVKKVKSLIGETEYNKLRQAKAVNYWYR